MHSTAQHRGSSTNPFLASAWYGYLHRDGRASVRLKGNMWKGPFHPPRLLWYCWRLLEPAAG